MSDRQERPDAYRGLDSAQFTRHLVPFQVVTNQSWPPPEVARRLRDVEPARKVQVWARVFWEIDGELWAAGTACRWWRNNVCVWIPDQRLRVHYVWLDAAGIRRRVLPPVS